MTEISYALILELTRGGTVESVHFGSLAIVDPHGTLITSYGDPNMVTFLRSSAKPFQALPFIMAGGHTHYNLTQQEIALICASHSGTDRHVGIVSHIQAKVGIREDDLMCGTHPVPDKKTAEAMLRRGEAPTPNRHNCSGKHSSMLAFARMNREPLDTYLDPDHPVQRRILQALSVMSGLDVDQIVLGTDGCSAPNFAIPLYHAAWAWARLADPRDLSPEYAAACRVVVDAMTAHPEMVGGPERFDTELMKTAGGRVVVKAGAEGFEGIGILPGALGRGSSALGIALKISDGDGYGRARGAVVLEILRQLGVFSGDELSRLEAFGPSRAIKNWRKLVVGEMRPTFDLDLN
jgi:L-asparaginase II